MRLALWTVTLVLAWTWCVMAQEPTSTASEPSPNPREGYRARQGPATPQPANKPPRRARQEDFTNGFYTADIRRQTIVIHDYTGRLPELERPLLPELDAFLPTPLQAPADASPLLPQLPVSAVPNVPPQPIHIGVGEAQVGGETRPAIALYCGTSSEVRLDLATAALRKPISDWARLYLMAKVGLADPMVESEGDLPPPTMRYTIVVNDRPVTSSVLRDRAWHALAVDLTDMAPADATVSLIAGHESDTPPVAVCFADVRIVEIKGPFYLVPGGRGIAFGFSTARFPRNTAGIAMAQVKNDVTSEVALGMGGEEARFTLDPGEHWLPIEFPQAGHFTFKPVSGDALLYRVDIAPQPKSVAALASPLP